MSNACSPKSTAALKVPTNPGPAGTIEDTPTSVTTSAASGTDTGRPSELATRLRTRGTPAPRPRAREQQDGADRAHERSRVAGVNGRMRPARRAKRLEPAGARRRPAHQARGNERDGDDGRCHAGWAIAVPSAVTTAGPARARQRRAVARAQSSRGNAGGASRAALAQQDHAQHLASAQVGRCCPQGLGTGCGWPVTRKP
jgi:hypothetical protein